MSKELEEKGNACVVQNGSASKIQITVTTFCEDENGTLDEKAATTSSAKIDGEDENSNISSSPQAQIIRNLLVLSFGQFLLFMAFDTMSNLQSTINGDAGVGVVSLAVIYGFLTFSSLFLPTLIIRSLGCKKTLVFSVISFCPYILANYYPAWSTLIPTAVVCGLVSGPLWSARSTYLNEISHRYAEMRGSSAEVMNAWFFSIATTIQQNTEIWGNLISYFVLMKEDDHDSYISTAVLDHCGPDFCDDTGFSSNPNLSPPRGRKALHFSDHFYRPESHGGVLHGVFLGPFRV
ncbi:protein unc-93 homolog A-like [Uloborus diversus]|uniref:protein unc-93 homolog A-like n=1 Tax=Uloborus diversus TaxID=327109 RepID=UPI00240A2B1F|nr:protein unc-93 homolog A-like [Uloborus diversus]